MQRTSFAILLLRKARNVGTLGGLQCGGLQRRCVLTQDLHLICTKTRFIKKGVEVFSWHPRE